VTEINNNLSWNNLKPADKKVAGVLAIIAGLFVGGTGLYIWLRLLPTLIELAQNTIYLIGMIIGIIILTSPIWDSGTRTALIYSWMNFSRNLRRTVARENPIGTYDTAISRFQAKLDEIAANLAKASGAYKLQDRNIKQFETAAQNEDGLAQAAKRQGEMAGAARHSRLAGKWDDAANALRPIAAQLRLMCDKMEQARQACINQLEDLKGDREVYKAQYDAIMAGQKAVSSFKSFFGENKDLEMLRLSVEAIDEQVSNGEAEIDQFLNDIKPLVETDKLKDAAEMQKALDRLNGSKLLTEGVSIKVGEVVREPEMVKA
jgi:hypothetical protein